MSTTLTFVTALGCGLMGGAFYVFSNFVMSGLRRLPAEAGAAAMQQINITAPQPPFMLAFIGTALLSVAQAVVAVVDWGDGSALKLGGAVLYLAGSIGVTAIYHQPRNIKLIQLGAEAGTYWTTYAPAWVRWNHVRTAACLAAAVLLMLALVQQ